MRSLTRTCVWFLHTAPGACTCAVAGALLISSQAPISDTPMSLVAYLNVQVRGWSHALLEARFSCRAITHTEMGKRSDSWGVGCALWRHNLQLTMLAIFASSVANHAKQVAVPAVPSRSGGMRGTSTRKDWLMRRVACGAQGCDLKSWHSNPGTHAQTRPGTWAI